MNLENNDTNENWFFKFEDFCNKFSLYDDAIFLFPMVMLAPNNYCTCTTLAKSL